MSDDGTKNVCGGLRSAYEVCEPNVYDETKSGGEMTNVCAKSGGEMTNACAMSGDECDEPNVCGETKSGDEMKNVCCAMNDGETNVYDETMSDDEMKNVFGELLPIVWSFGSW